MKCANPDCNRGIGLIAYRRNWFSTRSYCSKRVPRQLRSQAAKTVAIGTHFEWLFLQPIEKPQPKLMPTVVRIRAR